MLGDIAKHFEWALVRKARQKLGPFTILQSNKDIIGHLLLLLILLLFNIYYYNTFRQLGDTFSPKRRTSKSENMKVHDKPPG